MGTKKSKKSKISSYDNVKYAGRVRFLQSVSVRADRSIAIVSAYESKSEVNARTIHRFSSTFSCNSPNLTILQVMPIVTHFRYPWNLHRRPCQAKRLVVKRLFVAAFQGAGSGVIDLVRHGRQSDAAITNEWLKVFIHVSHT